MDSYSRNLVDWFKTNGGSLDEAVMSIEDIPGYGRGVVASANIPKDHTLFALPRSLTLSTHTSCLPSLLNGKPAQSDAWKEAGLNRGWVGLILCMMWEETRGHDSKWGPYLKSLPDEFDTPMFWREDDLEELKGTSVVGKLGKEEAENDYREKLLPVLQARPDLFPPDLLATHYTLERYHIMGSRILSRSFHVERWEPEQGEEEELGNTSAKNAMDVDETQDDAGVEESKVQTADEEAEGEENEEDASDVAMVPIADMLNARYGSENAKLFYERDELKMVSTKPIKAGDQIWNTYGDLPNAELLRRYGHVDLLPLSSSSSIKQGNPGDIVEIRADTILGSIPSLPTDAEQRVDWWLEEGGDDVFDLEMDLVLPAGMVSFIRLLTLSESEWTKAKKKGKPPRSKMDAQIAGLGVSVLERRLGQYASTLEEDEALLETPGELSLNKRHALIVRVGEKRILGSTLEALENFAKEQGSDLKRKGNGDGEEERSSESSKRKRSTH